MKRVAAIGECMIEFHEEAPGRMVQGFGGDTLNVAVYLARLAAPGDIAVDYVTALGDDPFSDAMVAAWRDEGLGTELVRRIEGRLPGLYIIRTDSRGERTFYYWRREAAARKLWEGAAGAAAIERLASYDLLYLTGISLAILDGEGRERTLALLDAARSAGARVAFDNNYRPALWRDADDARAVLSATWRRTDIGLPSAADSAVLFGDGDAAATARRLHECGVGEVVVKCGAAAALVSDGGGIIEVPASSVENVVDTSAAGDSFNAAYLAARLAGAGATAAARAGHALAGVVIQHRGTIIPRAAMPAVRLP